MPDTKRMDAARSYEEIIDFIAGGTTPEALVAFRLSEHAQIYLGPPAFVLRSNRPGGGQPAGRRAECVDRGVAREVAGLDLRGRGRSRRYLRRCLCLTTCHWYTDLPQPTFRDLVPRANEFAHPRGSTMEVGHNHGAYRLVAMSRSRKYSR